MLNKFGSALQPDIDDTHTVNFCAFLHGKYIFEVQEGKQKSSDLKSVLDFKKNSDIEKVQILKIVQILKLFRFEKG
jgi:hypothetical protein